MTLPEYSIHYSEETTSTNDEAMAALLQNPSEKYIIYLTDYQTSGRGQQSNVWESQKGKNLLYSIGVSPTFLPPHLQFHLLQIASLAICETLLEIHPGFTIKWPNDIYWNDYKISGTLIECRLEGNLLKHCVLGTGININQDAFSKKPFNPISLRQICHQEFHREEILEKILTLFKNYYQTLENGQSAIISQHYLSLLYHRQGLYPYRDREGTFTASIAGISPEGKLLLKDDCGKLREYNFKEVKYILADTAIN